MIIRPGATPLLITQPDHAALSYQLMQQWRTGGLPDSPRRDAILLAVREHDHGWTPLDAAPRRDAAGRVLDFMSESITNKQGVWRNVIAHVDHTPYAAALIAQHAVHVYRRYRDDPEWKAFFEDLKTLRDAALARTPHDEQTMLDDYRFVRIGDLLSLTFCNVWTDPQRDDCDAACEIRLMGSDLVITPDPFAGAQVDFAIDAREIPEGPVDEAAFARMPRVPLQGVARGA